MTSLLTFFILVSFVSGIDLRFCTSLTTPGDYLLMNNVGSSFTCFTFYSNDISLDGNNYRVTYGTSRSAYGIKIIDSINKVEVRDIVLSKLNTAGTGVFVGNNVSVDLINVKLIRSNISIVNKALVNIFWYFDSTVKDAFDRRPLSNVYVKGKDVKGNLIFTALTDNNGKISRQTVLASTLISDTIKKSYGYYVTYQKKGYYSRTIALSKINKSIMKNVLLKPIQNGK